MSTSQSFSPAARSPAYRYGLAIVAVAIALAIKLFLLPFEVPFPLSLSFLAVIAIAFWFEGDGPGVLAVLLSAAAFVYFVVPYQIDYRMMLPDGSVKSAHLPATFITTLPYLIYFVLVAIITSWFSSSRRSAERLLNQTRSDLEVTVLERTADLRQANQELQAEVAERKRMEETLSERAHLLDLTHDSVFVRDMDDVITYWNRGAEERYGWTRKEALGQISDDITGTGIPQRLNQIRPALAIPAAGNA